MASKAKAKTRICVGCGREDRLVYYARMDGTSICVECRALEIKRGHYPSDEAQESKIAAAFDKRKGK